MSSIAEKVFETVKSMTDQQAAEVLDFAEFLIVRKEAQAPTGGELREQRKADLMREFAKFHVDMSDFKFDREEANAR
jgi:phage shock protein A